MAKFNIQCKKLPVKLGTKYLALRFTQGFHNGFTVDFLAGALILICLTCNLYAGTYGIATEGGHPAKGTQQDPFASIKDALKKLAAATLS